MKYKYFVNKYNSLYLAFIILLFFQDGITFEPDAMNRARIKPTLVEINPAGKQQFYIVKEPGRLTAAYATNKVKWFVNGIAGGDKTVGTITTTAPVTISTNWPLVILMTAIPIIPARVYLLRSPISRTTITRSLVYTLRIRVTLPW